MTAPVLYGLYSTETEGLYKSYSTHNYHTIIMYLMEGHMCVAR